MVYSTLLPWIKIFGVNDVPPFPYGTKLWICAHASRLFIDSSFINLLSQLQFILVDILKGVSIFKVGQYN